MEKISKVKVIDLIKSTDGRLFSAEFIKKDGSLRKGVFRLKVKSHLKGGKNKVVKNENSYITVFDMKKQGYITMNLETLQKIKFRGIEYIVV